MVLDIDQGLPGALAGEGIVVVFDETVHEVHGAEGVIHPFDIVLVPQAQVAGTVVIHQRGDILLLEVVFSKGGGFLKLIDDAVDGGAVQAARLPRKFDDTAVSVLHDLGVEAIGYGLGIFGICNGGVITLDFVSGYAFIEIDRRGGDNVCGRICRLARGQEIAVVYDVHHFTALVPVANGLHQAHEILLGTLREEFVLGVVMMYAVREEHALRIDGECLELVAVAVAVIVLEYVLQDPADAEVISPVLVPINVAAPFGGLGQVIHVCFLLETEVLPSFDPVPDDAEVRKLVYEILESVSAGGILPA